MIFKRKIYNKFLSWKQEANGQKALLVEGARRIGKSTVVEEFAKQEYKSYIIIDFAKASDDVKSYFHLHLNDLDTFYMLLSVQYGVELHRRESIIIFDEVQLFPKAREAIKYLVADGRYDFTCSLTEKGVVIYSTTLVVDSADRVTRLKENFRDRPEVIYRGVHALLAGNMNYLFD
jgi:predicted AAA+ superfamily ATPase